MTNPTGAKSQPQLPADYPHEWVETAVLKDGAHVTIRPIRPDDAANLQEGFRRLSPESVYLRFFQTFRQLPERQAKDLAQVDYQNRMALVAEIEEGGEPQLIGVARYARVETDPRMAESAVVVVDEYQSRGLGSILLERLVRYAITHGVEGFVATIHSTNNKIMGFIKNSGLRYERKMAEPGVFEVKVFLKE